MEIKIMQNNLLSLINISLRAISLKNNTSILEGILFIAKDNRLTLKSTDLELAIETSTECKVEKEGEVLLNASMISNIVRKLPNDEVLIKVDREKVFIQSENAKFNIIAMDIYSYPEFPTFENKVDFTVQDNLLKVATKQTIFATAVDDYRIVLNGVDVEIENHNVDFVALDGHRIAKRSFKISEDIEKKVIIPPRALNEISKIVPEGTVVGISLVSGSAIFTFENTIFSTRVIDGEYLNYKALFSYEYKTKVIVSRRDLINAIERANIIYKAEKGDLVTFTIDDNSILVEGSSEIGDLKDVIDIKKEGDNLKIAFNSKYILEGLKTIEQDFVEITFNGRAGACIIRPEDENIDYTYLVLPVLLQDSQY